MYLIIIGCGRLGAELAYRLFRGGHEVVVIDSVAAAFKNLHPDFRGRTIEGEALNRDVLLRAGINQADGLAAVTNSDSLNAVVAHTAQLAFQMPRVIARNYDPSRREIFEAFGLQVVGSSSWGAQRIEEMLSHEDMYTVFSAGNGEVEIYEFTVPNICAGRKVGELLHGEECVPVALTRAGHALLPSPETELQKGDILDVSATVQGIEALRKRLYALQEA